jgi:preprotein translocase subunit SecD
MFQYLNGTLRKKMKIKLTWKIWLLIFVLVLSLLSIFATPNFLQKGVLIKNVEQNSTAFEQGLRQGQIIQEINGQKINNVQEFSEILQSQFTSGENVKITLKTKDNSYILYSNTPPDIIVSDIPQTNIKAGLDLAGGSRALVQAKDKKLTLNEVNDLVAIANNRFNVYGISDIDIRPVSDLAGNYFMLIEIAGATPSDLEKLISEQGEFEAKIGDEVVFVGGDKDITSVVRSGQSSGIYSCEQSQQGNYFCNFRFVVYLSEAAAEKHAAITDKLEINSTSEGNYLSKKLDLYLDGKLVNSLQIGESLKGTVTTQIQVSGSGTGATRDEAIKNAEEEMKQLQTVMITGSLPFKLEIVKLDTISPTLGNEFLRNIFLAGLAALLAISIVVFARYKKLKFSFALLLTSISEIILILGVASLIKWDLDLPSIAGILATIGTGIDDQIVILDESRDKQVSSLKQRLKRAFAIILGTYFTSLAALIPLYWAVAGLFKGFAVTTILGITIGVLITRPAFADIIKLMKKNAP